jgi:serine protease Do
MDCASTKLKATRVSLLVLMFGAVSCAGRTHDSTPAADAALRANSDLGASASETTNAAPAVDFRHQFVAAAKAIRPAVVSINSTATLEGRPDLAPFEGTPFEFFFRGIPHQGPRLRRGVGSGIVVDNQGHILTNNHVIADADTVEVVLSDNRELKAKVIGTDPKTDLAVIKVDPSAIEGKLRAAQLGDSDALQVGEWVLGCGSPFGLRQTVSAGIVSAVGRGNVGIAEYEDFIQTDAAINPGNSGGPLVDLSGRVVGVNTAIASASGGNAGVGFAIPINMAAQIMRQLLETGKVVRAYIGLLIADVTEDLAESFEYPKAGGVLVQDVTKEGPGARAGLEPGDIIIERDGEPVVNSADFRNGIAASAPNTKTALKIWRRGKEISKEVTLGEMPQSAQSGADEDEDPEVRWGLRLSDIPAEVRRRTAQAGALVNLVEPLSAAAEAGVQPGDILVEVGGEEVGSAADAARLLREAKSPVRIRIVRDGQGLYLMMSARPE